MTTANVEASSMDSVKSGLMDSIRSSQTVDFSGYKDNSDSAPQVDSTSETATQNNDTEVRGDSVEVEQQAQTSSQTDASQADTTKTEGDVSTRTEPTKKPRAPARIDELLQKTKAQEQEIARLKAESAKVQAPKSEEKKEPPKPRVPQPTPPQFTKEVLSNLLLKYRSEGNQEMVDQIHAEQEKWRQHDIDMVRWEFKNGNETEKHNGAVNYYKQEALKTFPGLNDATSPITREYTGIRGWLNEKAPAIFDLPEAEYLVAQIANWKLASGQVATSQAEIKKLTEELGKLKKGSLPITSSSKPEISGKDTSAKAVIGDAARNLKDQIRKIQGGNTF